MTLDSLLERLETVTGIRPHSIPTGYLARCPAHPDRNPSLSVSEAGDKLLLFCHAHCAVRDIVDTLGLKMSDLWVNGSVPDGEYVPREAEATYAYVDETGQHLYDVIRYPTRPDGTKDFIHKFKRVPYHLPQVRAAIRDGRTVYIVEGEKDADNLMLAGKTATCNSGGAGKWRPEFAKYFVGARVIIVRDKDEPGHEHARDVAACLYSVAESIHVVEAREGKDASDHLAAGLRPEDFVVVQEVKNDS